MNDEQKNSGDSSDSGPLGVDPPAKEPRAKISKESLMSRGEDECPSCGAAMKDPKATVCVACGYDMKANKKVRTKVGTEEVVEPENTAFCREGRVHWKILLGLGVMLVVTAAVLAFADPPANRQPMFYAVKVLLDALWHTLLGVGAVIVTAMFLRERVGQIEYGVSWMLIAVGAFLASIQVGQLLGAGSTAQWIVGALLGAATYLGAVWTGFRTSRDVVLLISGMHFVFWLVLWMYLRVGDLSVVAGSAPA